MPGEQPAVKHGLSTWFFAFEGLADNKGKTCLNEGNATSVASLLALVLFNALLAMAHAALVNSHKTQLRDQAESGHKGAKRVLDLTQDSTRLLTTYQFSLIVSRFMIAALATSSLAQPLINTLIRTYPGMDASLASAIGYLAVMMPAAFITYALGELVPASIGSTNANAIAIWVVRPMQWLMIAVTPFVLVMLVISRFISRVVGSDGRVNVVTEEEIMTLVDAGQEGGVIEDEEKEMIYSVLQLRETLAREVMVPRIDVIALELDTSVEDALATVMKAGHSRIPVYGESVDDVRGLLYAKDLLGIVHHGGLDKKALSDLIRPAYFVPESKRAGVLLKELQDRKIHMAIVVDEYGGTAGVVTVEDLIEEIVGEIQDEFDPDEEAEVVQHGEHEFTVDGGIDLDDLNRLLDVELPTDDSDTLGGFIFSQLGKVPLAGETVDAHNLHMRVESVIGRRIRKVHILRTPPKDETSVAAADEDREAEEPIDGDESEPEKAATGEPRSSSPL